VSSSAGNAGRVQPTWDLRQTVEALLDTEDRPRYQPWAVEAAGVNGAIGAQASGRSWSASDAVQEGRATAQATASSVTCRPRCLDGARRKGRRKLRGPRTRQDRASGLEVVRRARRPSLCLESKPRRRSEVTVGRTLPRGDEWLHPRVDALASERLVELRGRSADAAGQFTVSHSHHRDLRANGRIAPHAR